MVAVCQSFIDRGEITLFTVDSIDNQTWLNYKIHPDDRAKRYNDYDRYILQEVIPFVRSHGTAFPKFMVTGCDIGARMPPIFSLNTRMSSTRWWR